MEQAIGDWRGSYTSDYWREVWQDAGTQASLAAKYWIAYRSYPESFRDGCDDPSRWVGGDQLFDWELLVDTFNLACTSSERRFLMNKVVWATEILDSDDPAGVTSERIDWLLGRAPGDHAFRGDMMWNLVEENRILPAEVEPASGDLDEFVRRFPTAREWDEACLRLGPDGFLMEFDDLPTPFRCAVAVLAYKDAWYSGTTWSGRIAKFRALQ